MRLIRAGLVLASILAIGLTGSVSAGRPDFHCPDGWTVKVEAPPALDAVVLDAGTEFCVKAATDNSGILVADGTTSLGGYVTWLNTGGQTPGVSYYVIYQTPLPTPSPSASTSPEPTLPPESPTPSPSPSTPTDASPTPLVTLPPTDLARDETAEVGGEFTNGDAGVLILFGIAFLLWLAFSRNILGRR